MPGSGNGIIARNFNGTPRGFTVVFVVLFLAWTAFAGYATWTGHQDEVYIRDHGISGFGIVTSKYFTRSKTTSYYVNYKYTPTVDGQQSSITSADHEVSFENYGKYDVGSQIPIKYSSKNFNDTHLDVQGYWSDTRLWISDILKLFFEEAAIGIFLLMIWVIVGSIWRAYSPRAV